VTGLGEAAAEAVRAAVARTGRIVVLTGAGISAESGIPTFRGPEGYWTVGSEVHRPEELATGAFFRRAPDDVWAWYLHRLRVCRTAEPNAAHLALARLEQALGDRVRLITRTSTGCTCVPVRRRSGRIRSTATSASCGAPPSAARR
jgi:NAD-dependent deacetylase